MGAVNVTNQCIDGTQQATITATNGTTTITIDGIETHELTVGPGEHVIVWYGPASHDPSIIVEWNRMTVDVPELDCTPTTSQAEPTTSEAPTSTTASTVPPQSVPSTTWAIDIPQTAETIAVTGSTLPATGATADMAAPIGAGLLTIAAVILLTIRRRPA